MSYSLEIRQEAFSDVLEIVKWYDGKSSITGDAFLEELYTTLEIKKNIQVLAGYLNTDAGKNN